MDKQKMMMSVMAEEVEEEEQEEHCHNKLCEYAENDICVCECQGRLHRVKTDHRIEDWFVQ
jgi:hypothetical protein